MESYVRGSSSEYWMPVVVAPYGSGKTALLRHLEWFCRERLGVGAARVEFSSLVNFILERYGSIHESDLPRVVEEYVSEVLRAREGLFVLLVDEVEESYDIFRGVVEHETSPLRGLAEAIRNRSTRVYVVLALGPSSTLKEAVFGPVAWRSRIYTIPLLPKKIIEEEIASLVGSSEFLGLLANMVWWASKGRVAWARFLLDTVVPELLKALDRGSDHVDSLLTSNEALTREIVDGVPLFDRQGYRELRRFVDQPGLVPVLAVLVGPVPRSIVSRVAGVDAYAVGPIVGSTRLGVKLRDFLDEVAAWAEKTAKIRDFSEHDLEHALSLLEHVFQALSYEEYLPYDPQFLREALSVAADLAREIYNGEPGVVRVIESINPDIIAPEPVRLPEPVVYLRPSAIARIYPVAGSSPIVGCAKKSTVDTLIKTVEDLAPEELTEYWRKASEAIGLKALEEKRGVRVYVAPLSALEKLVPYLACEHVGAGNVVVVVLDAQNNAEPVGNAAVSVLEDLGITVARAGARLSMFVYSLLFNQAIGLQNCSIEALGPSDRRTVSIYVELLKSLVLEALASRRQGLLERVREKLVRLEERLPDSLIAHLAVMVEEKGAEGLAEEIEKTASEYRNVAHVVDKITRIAGPAHAADIPERALRELAEAVRALASSPMASLAGSLSSCNASTGSKILDSLLGLSRPAESEALGSAQDRLIKILDSAASMLEELPDKGLFSELRHAITTLSSYKGSPVLSLAWSIAGESLVRLEERLRALLMLYTGLLDLVDKLPSNVREEVVGALVGDLAGSTNLEEAISYAEDARKSIEKLVSKAESLSIVEAVEKKRAEILNRLSQIFHAEPLIAEEHEAKVGFE